MILALGIVFGVCVCMCVCGDGCAFITRFCVSFYRFSGADAQGGSHHDHEYLHLGRNQEH